MYYEKDKELDTKAIVNAIEKAVYAEVKPLGFRKYGRTLHRFVDEDISQVINFQNGCPAKGVYDVLWVNIGIRIPECVLHQFEPEENPKRYYPDADCNIRARLGEVNGQKEQVYDLHCSLQENINTIVCQIREYVIPALNALDSRAAILEKPRDYPSLDALKRHLTSLEEAMVWGRLGDLKAAEKFFNLYYDNKAQEYKGHEGWKSYRYLRGHLTYIEELANRLHIEINNKIELL